MSALNVMCSICMEFYKPDSVVYATFDCGHLFHRSCIDRWLRSAETCPRCQKPCNSFRIHRIYLDFNERTEADDELDEQYSNYPVWRSLEDLDMRRRSEEVLKKAIKCAKTEDGHDVYAARVYYGSDLLPAGYVHEKQGVFASYGCHSHFLKERIELLLDCECEWVPDYSGHVPDGAISTGYSELGETLYIGRGQHEDKIILGKVHPSHRVLYMPYQSREVNVGSYEVLVNSKLVQKPTTSDRIDEANTDNASLYPQLSME